MMNNKLILPLFASAATTAYRIAAFSDAANNSNVANASAATGRLIGVFGPIAHDQGDMADVQVDGEAEVELGGTVQAGDPLTTDAQGRAVVMTPPGAGVTHNGIGRALQPGVVGDRIRVYLSPLILRGA